jgi:PPOX class probable F420-dependent enzyme
MYESPGVAEGLGEAQARGVLEPWQIELLGECRVGRLGTIAAEGWPRLVPVCYALVDGAAVIAVDEKPKRGGRLARLRDIDRDPRVTLLVDRYDDDWARLAWVRIEGRAAVRQRGDERPDALEALRVRYAQYRSMGLEALPLIVVTPERVVGWRWGGNA